MRKYFILLGLVILLCYLSNFIHAQEEKIILENKFGNVTFSHKLHTESISCQICHHKGLDSPKCSDCHTKDTEVNYMSAFHRKCIDCHKEKAKGPVSCNDCHKK
ncbi:MAG: cytochrome c family protein [Candidatus Omnitrophica bacterium]|nr:cytochrome c family protein [Candidatus Omnitrophota bacterium]